MERSEEGEASTPSVRSVQRALWEGLLRHPVISGVMLVCCVGGAILGALFLTEDWSLARRLLAGALAGAGTGLLLTATKLYG